MADLCCARNVIASLPVRSNIVTQRFTRVYGWVWTVYAVVVVLCRRVSGISGNISLHTQVSLWLLFEIWSLKIVDRWKISEFPYSEWYIRFRIKTIYCPKIKILCVVGTRHLNFENRKNCYRFGWAAIFSFETKRFHQDVRLSDPRQYYYYWMQNVLSLYAPQHSVC